MSGTLWIVSTPIGNLGDLSPRAAEILGSVDLIACEDTRRTGLLLQHLGLKRPMRSLHEHNERARTAEILDLNDALDRLAALDERQARVVECRYFGGLSVEETAEALGISEPTVKREWRSARAWLYAALHRTPGAAPGTAPGAP